tara:strand:- start:358 stop:918 length:561 start_codon:yes stop_codon:yes gene_type:complete
MADKEVFDTGDDEVEIIEPKPKKGRKPMSEARKAQLKEQLRKAREVKKAKKEKGIVEPKPPKVVKVLDQVGGAEPLPPILVKAVRKNHSKEVEFLKMEIAELKKAGTTKEDLAMIKELKEELKDIRNIAKLYKQQQNENKAKEKKSLEKVEEKAPELAEPVTQPIDIPKVAPRYSTYKKSIWSQFT